MKDQWLLAHRIISELQLQGPELPIMYYIYTPLCLSETVQVTSHPLSLSPSPQLLLQGSSTGKPRIDV